MPKFVFKTDKGEKLTLSAKNHSEAYVRLGQLVQYIEDWPHVRKFKK